MRALLLIGFSFFALFSCNIDKGKRVDAEKRVYKSNDATKLFFRNVRASYYDKTTLEAAKLDVYRIRTRNLTEEFPVIHLALVNNWLQDEAYIIVEPNGFFSVGDTIRVSWQDTMPQEIQFVFGNKDQHTVFADKIYNNMLDGLDMYIHKGSESWPLFPTSKEREAFRVTMIDFYRLVQRL
jgi:hypothetical protein